MRTRLRKSGIIQQFIGYLIFLSILPVIVIGFTAFHTSRTILQQETIRYTLALVCNQRDYLDLQLEQIESLIANISGVEEIRHVLADEADTLNTFTALATQARIGYILNGYSNLRGLVSIDIFTVHNAHYHVGDTLNVENIRHDVHEDLFQRALQNNGFVTWTGIEENVNVNSSHKKVITAAKILQTTDHQTLQPRPIALFLVNYSVTDLYDHFQQVNLEDNAYLMVLDGQNRVVYHPDQALLGQFVSDSFAQLFTSVEGTLIQEVDDQAVAISYVRSAKSGWLVLGLVPLQTLTAKTASIGRTTLVMSFLCFAIIGFAAFLYNRDVVLPIRTITHRFQQLQTTPAATQAPLPTRGHDEIAELVQWFNAFQDSLIAKQQAEAQIQASLLEKEILLKEIHHRVKNNLQIISSLLNLQLEGLHDPAARAVFEDSKNRVRSMALIHEQLYQSPNLAHIDFAEYVTSLVNYLVRVYRVDESRIRVHLSLAPLYMGIDTAVPCGLILNELVSNAFKHAFTDDRQGDVLITLQPIAAGEATLSVSDNGAGLPATIDVQNTASLGLQLVATLVKQLKGTSHTANRDPDNTYRTVFTITFPVSTRKEFLLDQTRPLASSG